MHFRLDRVVAHHVLSNGVGHGLGATHLYELVHDCIKFILHILRHSVELRVLQLNGSLFCVMRLLKINRRCTRPNNAKPLFLFFLELQSLAE